MGIIDINVNTTGLVGRSVQPRRCTITTTDSLATVTTAGYLNNQNNLGFPVSPTDVFDIIYGFNQQTKVGTFGIFTVTYSVTTGFTLVLWGNPGDVLLPVVSGDFATFNGTTGQIKDAGYLPSNAALTRVVMESGASVIGHLAQYNDVTGTIIDSGIAASGLQILSASVSLNQAAIQAMYVTPFQIVAAVANKVIVPVQASLYTNFNTTAFAAGGVGILQYDTTTHGAGTNALIATIPAAEITAASSQIYSLAGLTASALTGTTNKGLFLSNQTQAFTGGNASSTLVMTVSYYLLTATV